MKKYLLTSLFIALIAFNLFLIVSATAPIVAPPQAQGGDPLGTAFTYQGMLNSGSGTANGWVTK